MWQRRTFHECASELTGISEDFRAAHTNKFSMARSRRDQIMLDTSRRGVEVLRILALSVRSEQDFGLTQSDSRPVGALRSRATAEQVLATIRDYRPPYDQQTGYTPLGLRQALNKIAHADPNGSGFFADNTTHDLILSGANQGGDSWIAVISVIDLATVIKSIPDVRTRS
jgi:hypothetical protein